MKNAIAEYVTLLDQFLDGIMSIEDFQMAYLKKFKSEQKILGDDVFEVLQDLFGDVDAFTADLELLLRNSKYYIDADALREKVRQAANRLSRLNF